MEDVLSFLMLIAIFFLIWWGTPLLLDNFASKNIEPGSARYHLNKSIEYNNEATKISNQQGSGIINSPENIIKIVEFKEKALEQAKLVDTSKFNSSFEDNFKNKYIKGLKLFLEGHEERDNKKLLTGQKLIHEWHSWFAKERNK